MRWGEGRTHTHTGNRREQVFCDAQLIRRFQPQRKLSATVHDCQSVATLYLFTVEIKVYTDNYFSVYKCNLSSSTYFNIMYSI